MWLPNILIVLLAVGYSQSQNQNYGSNRQGSGNTQQTEDVDWPNTGVKTGSSRGRVQSPTSGSTYPRTSGVAPGEPRELQPITMHELARQLSNEGYSQCMDHYTFIRCYSSSTRQYEHLRRPPLIPDRPGVVNTMTTTETYQPNIPVTNSEFGSSHDGLNSPTLKPNYNQQPGIASPGEHQGTPQRTWAEYERTLTAAGYRHCIDYFTTVRCWSPLRQKHVTLPHYTQVSDTTSQPQPGSVDGGNVATTPVRYKPVHTPDSNWNDNRQPNNERPASRPASRPNQGNSGYGANTNSQWPATTSPRPNYAHEPEREDHDVAMTEPTTEINQFINPQRPGLSQGGSNNRPPQRSASGRRPVRPSPDQQPDPVEPDDTEISEAQPTPDRFQPNINQGGSNNNRPRQPTPGSSTVYRNPSPPIRPTRPPYSPGQESVQQPEKPTYEDFEPETTTERYRPNKGGAPIGERGSADRVNRPRPQGSGSSRIPAVDDQEPVTENLDVTAQVADATCQFSLDVFKTVASSPGNAIMSPLSVQTLLAMLQQGARERSSQQLNDVLHVRPAISKAGYAAVIKEYQKHNELRFASKMFVNPDFTILPPFSKDLRDHFKTEATPLPRSSSQATSLVNDWVKSNTNNRITELVRPGDITSRTQLVLANVIHFKAEWLRTFDPEETKVEKFHTTPHDQVDVQMMQNEGLFYGGRDDDLGAYWVDMLYDTKNYNRDFSMLVVLPTEPHGLEAVIRNLNVGHLKKMIAPKITYRVTMKFPRFKLRADTSLKSILMQLGLTDVFDNRSHLEGVSRKTPLVVSEIIHSAEIEVTEEGTEAAGASALYGNALTITPNYPLLDFNATQPFLAIIVDKIHKMPLFMARVSNPGLFAAAH